MLRAALAALAALTVAAAAQAQPSHAPPPAASPAAPTGEVSYVAQRGDTLIDLAARAFNDPADWRQVARLNRIADPRRLPTGSRLRIPLPLLRTEPAEARVTAFRGDVAVVDGGGGRAPTVGMTVAQGAVLATGPDGFIALELPDGSRLSVPSRSRLRLTQLGRVVLTGAPVRAFALEAGRAETSVRPQGSARFQITTPVSVAAVRGTAFRATFDPASATAGTSVVDGVVEVAGAGAAVDVPEGRGVLVDAGGPQTPVALLAPPDLRNPDKVQEDAAVVFEVEPVAGAAAYRAQVSSDAGFVDQLAEAQSPEPRLTLPSLRSGTLFLRLTAIAPGGLEGLPADFSFERRRTTATAEPLRDCPTRRCLRFRWEVEDDGPQTHRFQLARAEDAVPVVDIAGLSGTEVVLTDLKGGDYVWRVQSASLRDGRRSAAWTSWRKLRVSGGR